MKNDDERTMELLLEFHKIHSTGKHGMFSEPIREKIRACKELQNKYYWRLSRGLDESNDYMVQLQAEIDKLINDAINLWIAEKKQ